MPYMNRYNPLQLWTATTFMHVNGGIAVDGNASLKGATAVGVSYSTM